MKANSSIPMLLVLFLLGIYSPPVSGGTPGPPFTAVITADIDVSAAWYSCVFSLVEINRDEMPDRGLRQANLSGRMLRLELIEISGSISREEISFAIPDAGSINGYFKTGFTVRRFDKWLEHLESCEVEFHGKTVIDPTTGKRMIIALDPDGNRIQFFEK